MHRILTRLAAAAAVVVLGAGAASAETKVGIAAEPYPPFTVPDAAGNWSGWEIEIMDALCEEAKLDCTIVPTAWDGIIPALTSGKIDMIIGSMSITEERLKVIDFSDKYYNTPTAIIGLKDVEIEPTNESLSGKLLGVQRSTIHENYVHKHFPDAEVKTYQTQDEANQDLVAGRLDAVQADSLALATFLESDSGKACCDMKGEVEPDEEILGPGVGVGLRKGDTELKEKLNKAIAAIRENGTYEKISEKYFDFDIYGK
ncbi:transporter substrate-binding domain-containing protein [Afifella sp. H1R]|uniref:transporter substrate-binding domain-containing protein n=1 Tax=unclassified Afifella TaxID=2624128 RepID=UPI001F468927|nr:transporter substrate-binding domain-containing protein [Afifella sp. H1R]MCF1502300.1 transporter substrate-binding domain-containing protein [Afifella sp. H1R]